MNETFNKDILSTEDKECLETIKRGDPYTIIGFSVYSDWNKNKVLKLTDTDGVFLIADINPGLFRTLEEGKYYQLPKTQNTKK